MSSIGGPNTVSDGLVLHLDAANTKSYANGSTTWNDLSGNGNNGTLINGPTFNSGNGGSVVFDGVNDYVTIQNSNSINMTDNFTINMFVKSTVWVAENQEGLVSKGPISNYSTYLRGTSGTVSFYTSTTDFWAPGPNIGGDNKWHFLTFIYSYSILGQKQIYYNGQFYSQKSVSVPIQTNTSNLDIGYSSNVGTPRFFKGNFGMVGFYNKVLTPSEILQNYNATKSRFEL
jgi:hypothetical protein